MRRLVILAAVCVAALLLPAAASAAPNHDGKAAAGGPLARPHAVTPAGPAGARFVPLARTLTGNATLLVHVYSYGNGPEAGAMAGWWVGTDTESASGSGVVDADGLVAFTGVPAATENNGEIMIQPVLTDAVYSIWNLGWTDPVGIDMGVQPGRFTLRLNAGGPWPTYSWAAIDVIGRNGDAYQYTGTVATQTGTVTDATPVALNGDLQDGAVYFWNDEGVELPLSGLEARPGQTTSSGIVVNQADAQRLYNPTWASGKPGSIAKISFQNFPAGWSSVTYGMSQKPSTPAFKSYNTWTSAGGASPVLRSLAIPKTAPPGFTYDIYAQHSDGPLLLWEPFQVCTFTPSRTAVSSSGYVRFSGRVPFKKGSTKRVLVYRRTSSAGQPAKAGGFSLYNGWRKVGSCTTNGYGQYTTPSFRPGRTSWYVLWYPGDGADHWGAWTSVAKVAVR